KDCRAVILDIVKSSREIEKSDGGMSWIAISISGSGSADACPARCAAAWIRASISATDGFFATARATASASRFFQSGSSAARGRAKSAATNVTRILYMTSSQSACGPGESRSDQRAEPRESLEAEGRDGGEGRRRRESERSGNTRRRCERDGVCQ